MAIDDEPAAPTTPEAPNDPSAPRARKRHVTRGILILMILTVAGVVAPFIANIFASHSGAGLDSTKVFQVGIQNDTAVPLDAQLCDRCLPTVPKVSILPGDSAQVNVSAGGSVTLYYLIDRSGATVGCLPLRFSRPVSGFAIATSRAEKCPGDPINVP